MTIRRFAYDEPNMSGEAQSFLVDEGYILKVYFPYWAARLNATGRPDLVDPELCIEDWCIVHGAWEVFSDT